MDDRKQVVVDVPENAKSLNESTTVQKESARKTSRIISITGLIIFLLAAVIPSKYKSYYFLLKKFFFC